MHGRSSFYLFYANHREVVGEPVRVLTRFSVFPSVIKLSANEELTDSVQASSHTFLQGDLAIVDVTIKFII